MLYSSYISEDVRYLVALDDSKKEYSWYLFSEERLDGKPGKLFNMSTINSNIPSKMSYLVSSIKINKVTREELVYNPVNAIILRRIADRFIDTSLYSYPKDFVTVDITETRGDVVVREFSARHNSYRTHRVYENGLLVDLAFSDGVLTMSFSEGKNFAVRGVKYTVSKRDIDERNVALNISYVTMDVLRSSFDISFYEESTGMDEVSFDAIKVKRCKKNYLGIHSKSEFIELFFLPFLRKAQEYKSRGEIFRFSMDTETTGFGLYNLSEGNPHLDNIVSFQVSWEEDQGCAIWLDMDSIANCDLKYAMGLFSSCVAESPEPIIEFTFGEEHFEFDRKDFYMVGHNTIFDTRVFLRHGFNIAFDMDTLQMAYTIDSSKFFRRGLKELTKKCFNVSYPSLSDLLGAGNEDKFKYIVDEEVARLYSCADTDYTLQLYYTLKDLIEPRVYRNIEKYDKPMWYLCATSEYEGITLDVDYVKTKGALIKRKLEIIEKFSQRYVGQVLHTMYCNEVDVDYEGELIFPFKMSGDDLRYTMYTRLRYPKLVYTKTGEVAVNKVAMKKLMTYPGDRDWLKSDVLDEDGNVVIEAKVLNSYKYGLAYLLTEYKTIEKEYTAYYKPFEDVNMEGKLFKKISTTSIQTRRISCSIQTIKGDLKEFVLPPSDDYYICDFDFNQIEARMFSSIAGDTYMINKLHDPEKDYHTENAANIFNYKPHQVPKKKRSQSKGINFGLPYGLGKAKMTENLFSVINEDTLFQTGLLISDFKKANKPSMDLLENYRESARTPNRFIPKNLLDFWGEYEIDEVTGVKTYKPVGIIHNITGFYRHFPLSEALDDKGWLASIGRKAGNFPIQSLAADFFKLSCNNLHEALKREGLRDKVKFLMYIHDELMFAVHKSIDPRTIVRILNQNCQFRVKGHTTYFIGINFGLTWGGAKSDKLEIGPLLAKEIATSDFVPNEWTDDPNTIIAPMIVEYEHRRLKEVILAIDGVFNDGLIDYTLLNDSFTNYTVRKYMAGYPLYFNPKKPSKGATSEDKEMYDSLVEFSSFLSLVIEMGYSDCKVRAFGFRGKPESFYKKFNSDTSNDLLLDEVSIELDLGEDYEEDDFWSFDNADTSYFDSYAVDEQKFNSKEDVPIELPKFKYKFDYVVKRGHTRILSVTRSKHLKEVESFLEQYKSPSGNRINLLTAISSNYLIGKYDIDDHFDEIDKFLSEVNERR